MNGDTADTGASAGWIALRLCKVLEDSGVTYALLGPVEDLPLTINSDLDVIVDPRSFERMPSLIYSFASLIGGRVVQQLQHESSSRYYVLNWESGVDQRYLAADLCSDYVAGGRLVMKAAELLKNRRQLASGVWVPSIESSLKYYVRKKRRKLDFTPHAVEHLRALLAEPGSEAVLQQEVGASAPALAETIKSGDLLSIRSAFSDLGYVPPKRTILLLAAELHRVLVRFTKPTGMTIAVYGPDGAGKSTVIRGLVEQIGPCFRRIRVLHFRPRLHRPTPEGIVVTDPHAEPSRSRIASIAKALFYALDAFVSHYGPGLIARSRSTLIIFDRYPDDALADPKRYRMKPDRLTRWILRHIPSPDVRLFLSTSVSDILSRKQEIEPHTLAEIHRSYEALELETSGVRIDASQTVAAVAASAARAVLSLLAVRQARRDHALSGSDGSAPPRRSH